MENEVIRVAHIVGKWLGGGVESVVMNYYKNIDRSKIQFDFICDEDSTNIPFDEIKELGGKVIIVPSYSHIFSYNKELNKIFKENKYKIVHSHINTLNVFPLRIARKCKVPIRISHSHSTSNKKEIKKNIIKSILKPFSKLYATDYYACSKYAGIYLFGQNTKFNILNNAIDLDKFKYNKKYNNEIRKELNISSDTFVIGHVGRFVTQKNHSFLIDIFYELQKTNPNSALLLVGQGPLQDKIKLKVKNLHIEDKVYFLNQRNDVYKIFSSFDVFLLPSLYEGLPVVGVEAQASGLLCVLSDNMTKETKVLESTVFVSSKENASYWSKTILDNYKDFQRKDCKNELVKANFEIKSLSKELENIYINLLENNKKKVFFLVSTNIYSGAEAVNLNIINNLKDDFNFTYVSPKGSINTYLCESNINHIEISKLSISEIKRVIKDYKPDIIHATDYRASVLCSIASKKIPYISHLHNNSPWLKKLCINSIAYLFAGLRAKFILTVSNSIKKEYIFSKFIKNKIYNISNPISRNNILSKVDKNDKKEYDICFIGRLTEQKNPLRLIKIISLIKEEKNDIKAVIVGDGELREECEKEIIKLDLKENISLVGFQKNPYTYLNKSKVFLFPSIWEGFGLVLFEALSLGVPCFTTKVGGIVDIVNNECGAFCKSDKEFVENIISTLSDENKYKKLSEGAILRSQKLDNSITYYKKVKEIYEKL